MTLFRNFSVVVAALAVALIAAVACFSEGPSDCIRLAEEAGFSDRVIDQLRNPGELSASERAGLNRALSDAGIAEVCGVEDERASRSSGASEGSESSDLDRAAPAQTESERSSETEVETGTDRNGDGQPSESANAGEREEPTRQADSPGSSARVPHDQDDAHRRRCRFWAMNNLQPVVYGEFAKLNPDDMDDLDRILWRTKLNPEGHLGYYDDDNVDGADVPPLLPRNPGIYCRDYWAEPLNRGNAELRNHGFERECRGELGERIRGRYRRLAEVVNYQEDNDLVYQTPNQYVRILEWLDLSGDELLNAGNPPYRILQQQSQYAYAYFDDWIPTEGSLEEYNRQVDSQLNLEWLGMLRAAGITDNSSRIGACHYYYLQLFYGYWIPFDPDRMLSNSHEQEIELPKYDAATTPLYLPESVSAERIREGYPLGKSAEAYHICRDYGDTEKVGYYYVEHPTGDYCERKP